MAAARSNLRSNLPDVKDTRAWVESLLADRPGRTHGMEHIARVLANTIQILEREKAVSVVVCLAQLLALLHDVADHKYDHDGVLRRAVLERYGQGMLAMMDAISYSNQTHQVQQQDLEGFCELERQTIRIVRDADRLDAIGLAGLDRCREFVREIHPGISDEAANQHVRKHFHEKLVRLYPDHFIVTESGRSMALPLHQEMCAAMGC